MSSQARQKESRQSRTLISSVCGVAGFDSRQEILLRVIDHAVSEKEDCCAFVNSHYIAGSSEGFEEFEDLDGVGALKLMRVHLGCHLLLSSGDSSGVFRRIRLSTELKTVCAEI